MVKRNELCSQAGSGGVPASHAAVLAERLHSLDRGSEPVSSWAEAKARIRAQTKTSYAAAPRTCS